MDKSIYLSVHIISYVIICWLKNFDLLLFFIGAPIFAKRAGIQSSVQ